MRRIGLVFASVLLVLCAGCADGGDEGTPDGGTPEDSTPSPWEDPTEVLFTPGQMSVGDEWAESEVLGGLDPGTRIGALIDLHIPSAEFWLDREILARGFSEDGVPTEWLPAEVTFAEAHYVVARADAGTEVIAAQLRLPAEHLWEVGNLSVVAATPASDEVPVEDPGDLETERAALSISSVVTPRSAWNAKPTNCASYNQSKWRMAIHHTVTAPTYGGSYAARVKAIQAYHMDVLGWCDVGYHYLITEDGTVWEGRPIQFRGAHVGNQNTGNIGISFVGCFEPGECGSIGTMWPTQGALSGAGDLIGALAGEYGITIGSAAIKPHRDYPGASTSCPGDNVVEKIPTIFALADGGIDPGDLPDPGDQTSDGRIMGVVWDASVTDGPADAGVVRLDGADVAAGGQVKPVATGSAYWEFVVSPGEHTVTASAPGYETAAKTVTVGGGAQVWTSIGLQPETDGPAPGPGTVTLRVRDSGGAPIPDSLIHIPGAYWRVTDAAGELAADLTAGPMTFTAYGAGYAARTLEITVAGDMTVDAVLQPAPKKWWTGTVKGAVWDLSITDGPADDGALLVDDAMVVCDCGLAARVREGDAYWAFDVNPGEYTFVADAPGYQFASEKVAVSYKGEEWASIGLEPKQ